MEPYPIVILYENDAGVRVMETATRTVVLEDGWEYAEQTAAPVTGTSFVCVTPCHGLTQPSIKNWPGGQVAGIVDFCHLVFRAFDVASLLSRLLPLASRVRSHHTSLARCFYHEPSELLLHRIDLGEVRLPIVVAATLAGCLSDSDRRHVDIFAGGP